jgi:hypothetical protein
VSFEIGLLHKKWPFEPVSKRKTFVALGANSQCCIFSVKINTFSHLADTSSIMLRVSVNLGISIALKSLYFSFIRAGCEESDFNFCIVSKPLNIFSLTSGKTFL